MGTGAVLLKNLTMKFNEQNGSRDKGSVLHLRGHWFESRRVHWHVLYFSNLYSVLSAECLGSTQNEDINTFCDDLPSTSFIKNLHSHRHRQRFNKLNKY
jgi:hypothetical protein